MKRAVQHVYVPGRSRPLNVSTRLELVRTVRRSSAGLGPDLTWMRLTQPLDGTSEVKRSEFR